jgi:carbonic anhydrase
MTADHHKLKMILLSLFFSAHAWNYSHHGHDWGDSCISGHKQTPININGSKVVEVIYSDPEHMELDFKFKSVHLQGVQTDASYVIRGDMGFLTIYKNRQVWLDKIKIVNVHFHSPGENQLNGEELDLEMHMVMQDPYKKFSFLVFGVLFKVGEKQNAFVQKVIHEYSKEFYFSLDEAFENHRIKNFFMFEGSLTTPPCTEDVIWFVDDHVRSITLEEFEMFNHLWKANISFADGFGNNREIQDSHDRIVWHHHAGKSYFYSYVLCGIITIVFIYVIRK